MILQKLIEILQNDDNSEALITIFKGVSEKQKFDLIDEIFENKIEIFAWALEAILENTHASSRYRIMIYSLKKISQTYIEETHLISILPVIYMFLNNVSLSTLTDLAEYLLQEICLGTSINILWNELLPRILQIIIRNGNKYFVSPVNIKFLGYNYRTKFVDQFINSCENWKMNTLPQIASMLKQGIPITENERFLLFDKLCNSIEKMDPKNLSTFTYHLFEASFNPKLFIGVLFALDKYFKHYYWVKSKNKNELEPSQSSIMAKCAEDDFRQEADVIISQIFHIMEYNFTEKTLTNALKEFTLIPDLLLTPFMFESLLAMTRINLTSNSETVSASILFTKIIHTAIDNNFIELDIVKSSFYIKNVLEDFPKANDIQHVIEQLIFDSSKGLAVLTPGLFGLAYSLLGNKKQNQHLYDLASIFICNFLHRRPQYTRGVFEKLLSLTISFPEALQYKECLEKLANSKSLLNSANDYHGALEKALSDIPCMSSGAATNVLTLVLPLLRKSTRTNLRMIFTEALRKAVTDSHLGTRQMACYGCTLLLKQIKYSELTKITRHNLTAAFITGYSLINQMTQMNRNNLNSHDMLTLEIFGILTKVLGQNFQVKEILYKGLRKAAEANLKVLPHIIDLMIGQFKEVVAINDINQSITLKLDKLIVDNLETVVVKDHFGIIMELLVHCLVVADSNKITFENIFLRNFLTACLVKVLLLNLEKLGITGTLTQGKYIIATQFLNFLEAIMSFGIWTATPSNGFIPKLLKVYDHFNHCFDELKRLANPKTGNKRKKETWLKNLQNIKCVWDLETILRFLNIYYGLNYYGLTADLVDQIRSKHLLKIKLLKSASVYFQTLRNEPHYLQVNYSKKHFNQLCECSKVTFDRLFYDENDNFCSEEFLLLFEIFKQTIITATKVFDRKFELFILNLPNDANEDFSSNICRIIAQMTNFLRKLCVKNSEALEFIDNTFDTKLFVIAVSTIDILLVQLPAGLPFCLQVYDMILSITKEFIFSSKSLGIVFKLLFALRQKSKPFGDFDINIAKLLSKEYDHINPETADTESSFELKGITKQTLEPFTNYFLISLKSQLDKNAFLLKKANSLIYRLIKIPGQKKYSEQIINQIKEIEKLTINLLIAVCNTMICIVNSKVTLGSVSDNTFRALISLYSNGEKLARIYLNHHLAVIEEIDFFGLKELCMATKKLTRPVATFILYIEELSTVAASSDKLTGNQARQKILRDARLIPKYVYWFEKFSVEIIRLSNKTNQPFNKYLHLGIYRDFRIKTEELRKAINKKVGPIEIQSHNSAEDFEGFNEDTEDSDQEDVPTISEEIITNKRKRIA